MKQYKELNEKFRHLEEAVNFHTILASATGNVQLAKILDNLHQQVWLFRRKTYDASGSTAFDAHRSIVNALANGETAEAQRCMHEHIFGVRKKLVAQLSGQQEKPEVIHSRPAALSGRAASLASSNQILPE